MEYIVFVRVDGDWKEIGRIEADNHAEAIRLGELSLPAQYKGRAMGLKPLGVDPNDVRDTGNSGPEPD